ncbi:MAG: hypothetical protein KAT65_21230 [Methanophagales archaeon]|nr:hypothetical protein [Methanophagales archaeon]
MKAKKGKKDVNKAMQRERDIIGNWLKSGMNGFNTSLFNSVDGKYFTVAIIAILFFCFVAMASAQDNATTPKGLSLTGGDIVVVIVAAIVILAAFVWLIRLGYSADKELEKGELRRAIAGTFVVGFSIIAFLSYVSGVLRVQIVTAYIELVGIIIGFYFGQRAAETKPKEEEQKK